MFTNNYSGSKCAKCNSSSFETVLETPSKSNFKLQFIRCSSCKTVIGVADYYNLGALIYKLAKKMGINLDS
ncbi:hypothetical protein AAFH68_24260 [Flavobacterium sp. CGRL1]